MIAIMIVGILGIPTAFAEQTEHQPGDEKDFFLGDSGLMITMVWIPAGTFLMGASSEAGLEDEFPQHVVIITQGFWLGKYEVTQEQWQAVVGEWIFYHQNCPFCPADQVSWTSIQKRFLPNLGEGWRLPTEAEWEYACRAGKSGSSYWWGTEMDVLGLYAWYAENSQGLTRPVGQKMANPWGLYDILGNVAEWCNDWHDKSWYGVSPTVNPTGPERGFERVLRGGSFDSRAHECSSETRDHFMPPGCANFTGFRLVKEE